MNKNLNEKQNVYMTRMCELFTDSGFIKMILFITPAISKFLECVKCLSKQKTKEHIILMDYNKTLLKYTVLLFEVNRCLLLSTLFFILTTHSFFISGVKMEVDQSISCYKQDTIIS